MRRPIPDLKYVQVQKKRDEKGRFLEINTVFVESRNGKFRKDDARFIRKYHHQTPAMAQKIIDKPLSVKELLVLRPQLSP